MRICYCECAIPASRKNNVGTGEELNELLVSNGLARIYRTKTVLYDGRDSESYVAKLKELEAKPKKKNAAFV